MHVCVTACLENELCKCSRLSGYLRFRLPTSPATRQQALPVSRSRSSRLKTARDRTRRRQEALDGGLIGEAVHAQKLTRQRDKAAACD